MKFYASYLTSGEISVITTLQDDIDPGLVCNKPFIEVDAFVSGDTHWFNGVELIAYTSNAVAAKQNRPGLLWTWNPVSGMWIDARSATQVSAEVRSKRNELLLQSDWTQLADIPQQTKTLWEPYRQALRDVTLQSGYPTNIVWPIKPQ
jgi:hypothetical protein